MNFQSKKWSMLPVAVLMAGTVAFAQDPSPTSTTDPIVQTEIDQRKENQQDRIANGIKSGRLTAGETSKLENQGSCDQRRNPRGSRREWRKADSSGESKN